MNEKARPSAKTPALPEGAEKVYRKVPVIVEGVDCSGKTTFCRWLVDELITNGVNVEFCHHGPLRASVMAEYYEPLEEYCLYPTAVVADRWHLGEAVYGPLYRGKSEMTRDELLTIEELLSELGARRILLDPPANEVLKRMRSRGEDFLKPEDLDDAKTAYRSLAHSFGYQRYMDSLPSDAARIAKGVADECRRHSLQVR